jgi:hypothetical protein
MMKRRDQPPPTWQSDLGSDAPARYQPRARVTKEDRTNITFFLARTTHTKLKEMALARNLSLQQLLAVAVDEFLARAGGDTFKETDAPKPNGEQK